MLQYSPKITTDGLVMCLDASQNKSYPTTDLPVKDSLILWLDAADDTVFSYSSGTVVSQWRDKSGLNNHVIQPTVANQPSRSTIKNSRKTVVFDGSNDNLYNTGNVFPSSTTNYTKIAVVYQTSTATTGNVISSKTATVGSSTAHAFYFSGTTYIKLWHDVDFVTSSTALNTNTLGIISGTYVNSTGLGSLYVNGTASGTGTAANRNIRQDIQIGGVIDCCFFTGEICEVLVFSKVLSTTELKQVHTYLGQKWGILNTDRSIIDLSGFNDNGLLGNGTTANMPLYDYYNKGSFLFDGSNDYIVIPNSSSLKSTSSLTVEAWVLISSSMNYYGAIVGKGVSDTNEEYCLLVHYVNNKVYFDVGSGGGPYVDASYTFALNTWYHISVTHLRASGSSDIKIYINGSQVSGTVVNPTNAVNDNTDNVTIGSRFTTPTSIWNGKIGSVKIYNRNLSATEVAQNYEAQKSKFATTIIQQGLVLNLDAGNPYSYAGAGTTWYDVSGIGNNGTLTNGPTYSRTNDGNIVFDGTDDYVSIPSNNNFNNGNNITVEAWVLCTNWSSYTHPMIVAKGINVEWILWKSNDVGYVGKLGWRGAGTAYTTTSLPNNTWVQCVGSIGSAGQKVYLNGVLESTVGNTTFTSGNVNVTIAAGLVTGSPANLLGANVAITRIYNTQLTDAQVLQNYNATKGRFGL